MKCLHSRAALALTAGIALASASNAAVVQVNSNISTSTTWTNNNVYRLQQQIYVLPGATLTIEPGTVIASTTNVGGSLAVTRGAKIIANGTQNDPIIFTSTADVATWANMPSHPTGKNPKTGTWREAINEWGNLTIMGRAYVSNGPGSPQFVAGNTATFNPNNVAPMEGLVAAFPGDPNVLFGGGDDNDDSGTLKYVSLRYGGKVVALNNELNGLSLGGIGRETDIHHVDIMNNVDDGIEVWGGTVNLKYVNIWNIGDDSLDVDMGWRGKAQFGLIVQGYSADAAQGSGVGDNLLEMDGAQDSDCQPVTSATIYNFTGIGQPAPGAGDHATAWRDNARVQVRNCIFMDLGDRLISFDNVDGDGNHGYGFNGTLTWNQTWNQAYTNFSTVNAPPNPALFYTAQSAGDASIQQGRLAEMTDSVFFRNLNGAYGNNNGSDAMNVTVAGGSAPNKGNVVIPGFDPADAPVQTLNRGAAVVKGGMTMLPITGLDPRAKNAATSSVSSAPNDGFFIQAQYRGGFSPTKNWLCNWTAADAFGFNIVPAGSCVTACASDINGDNATNVADLLAVIGTWGPCAGCAADINGDGTVNVADLLAVITGWGACP
jgi:hypothetical protein